METDDSLPSITYNTLVAQAKQHQTSNQLVEYMETDVGLPPITYKPPVVQYNRVPSLTYKPPVVEYNHVPSLTYKPPLAPHTPSLTYNQNNQLQTLSNQSPGLTYNQPQNTRPTYNRPIRIEQTLYLYTICETPTKFADYHKLSKHIEKFHSAFNQDTMGVKRAKEELAEVWPKKLRWE